MISTKISVSAKEVNSDWEKKRCRPDVMLMASLYGHDMADNIQYCLKGVFDMKSQATTLPFYSIMGTFTGVLSTMMSSINSVKMTFATIVGSAYTVFSEFSSRIKTLMYTIQHTAIRMKFMMSRLFTAMHAILYMGQSAIRAGMNFEQTDLWNTIRGFSCFDPDTEVRIIVDGQEKAVKICDLQIGDMMSNGEKITATFRFNGDGQKMVVLRDGPIMSAPHRVLFNGEWIHASCHPSATPMAPWRGGDARPLICVNTTNHRIQIGDYTFTDYDETVSGNLDAMKTAMEMMNNASEPSATATKSFVRACGPDTLIKMADNTSIPANRVTLGMKCSHGRVTAVTKILTDSVCEYKGIQVSSATAVWSDEHNQYMRANSLTQPTLYKEPLTFYSFMISPSAVIETAEGIMFRDYLEIHDSQIESSYAKALDNSTQRLE